MLEVTNLEVVYHQVVLVLKGVTLRVPAGETVALLGPNGAGKTTALRAVTGLLDIHEGRITKGSVRFDGREVAGRRADAIVGGGLAQVMEGRRVLVDLSVEENLLAGAWSLPRREAAAELERAFERFAILADRRRQQAGYLSGGEQQMLAIARALMSRPRMLLLDEPSLGLAPRVVGEVAELISTLAAEGLSILLVEQNAAMALSVASHASILENGRIVREGPAAELAADEDVREFYLGLGGDGRTDYRRVKHYRRRKRWLS
ncbi:MAG: ABC transporter ATP-binding protein [Planctomycetota bacterium]|jgi:branched-chain amino acid transport system ATP-binding protein|nr:ABC transporter ATP-binding protein [Planctomycetota bacterium]MDP6764084.1 ABC transporter ATP-binding protein [Planctomycetota bacterium]MDP6989800.1 ABC transporter ATP-binding protein [Planctomycetota bacterium]